MSSENDTMGYMKFNPGRLSDYLFQLKFQSKVLANDAKKYDQKRKVNVGLLKQAQRESNEEKKRIYAEAAINNLESSKQAVRLSARLDSIASRFEQAMILGRLTPMMNNTVVALAKCFFKSHTMDGVAQLCDRVESTFETVSMVEVAVEETLEKTTVPTAISYQSQVDELIKQVEDESGLQHAEHVSGTIPSVPGTRPDFNDSKHDQGKKKLTYQEALKTPSPRSFESQFPSLGETAGKNELPSTKHLPNLFTIDKRPSQSSPSSKSKPKPKPKTNTNSDDTKKKAIHQPKPSLPPGPPSIPSGYGPWLSHYPMNPPFPGAAYSAEWPHPISPSPYIGGAPAYGCYPSGPPGYHSYPSSSFPTGSISVNSSSGSSTVEGGTGVIAYGYPDVDGYYLGSNIGYDDDDDDEETNSQYHHQQQHQPLPFYYDPSMWKGQNSSSLHGYGLSPQPSSCMLRGMQQDNQLQQRIKQLFQ